MPKAQAEAEEMLADPAMPFWAQDIIRTALTKDPCDTARILARLSRWAAKRADEVLHGRTLAELRHLPWGRGER